MSIYDKCINCHIFKTIVNIRVVMPHKNIRKIIRVGTTSFAIIIPKDWLRFHELGYGDRVEVVSNGSVKIKPIKMGGKLG